MSSTITLFNNETLDAAVPDAVKPKYLFISDSIIYSVPLTCPKQGGSSYDGLSIVVAKTIEISHKLMLMGYLVRGGISVGPVWHTARNIALVCLAGRKARAPPRALTSSVRRFRLRSLQKGVGGPTWRNPAAAIWNWLSPGGGAPVAVKLHPCCRRRTKRISSTPAA
jgi:hypothetical protein